MEGPNTSISYLFGFVSVSEENDLSLCSSRFLTGAHVTKDRLTRGKQTELY